MPFGALIIFYFTLKRLIMKKPLIITHRSCLDGLGAAWAAKHFLGDCEIMMGSYNLEKDTTYDSTNAALDLVFKKHVDLVDRDVYILDLSYPENVLEAMRASANVVVVIDHHETAKQKLGHLSYCHIDTSKCGCVLAWEYYSKKCTGTIKPIPEILLYIQDRDLWRHELMDTEAILEHMHTTISISTSVPTVQLEKFKDLAENWDAENYAVLGKMSLTFKRSFIKRMIYNHFKMYFSFDLPNGEQKEVILPACFCPWEIRSEVGHQLAKLPDNTHQVGLAITGIDKQGNYIFSARGLEGTTLARELAELYQGGGHNTAASGRLTAFAMDKAITHALYLARHSN